MTVLLQAAPSRLRAARRARLSVVLTAAALVAAALYLGWKDGYFTPVAHFHFEARSSKALSKGMAVHLSGFKIGQVSNVELLADRSVQVELAIFQQYLDFIRTDCEVRLESGTPLGDASLEVAGGPSRAAVAEPGSKLRYRDQPQLFDQLGGVVEKIEPLVENLGALLAQARQPQGELQTSLRNLAEATAGLKAWAPGFMARADETLASFKQTSSTATTEVTTLTRPEGDLQSGLRDFHAATGELRQELPVVLTDLKALTASLRATAAGLEPAILELAPKLPGLVDEGRRTAAGAGEVVDAAKDLPLIRGRVGQPVAQPLLPTTPP